MSINNVTVFSKKLIPSENIIRKESGIYKIINLINNRIYIGSAVNLRYRNIHHYHFLSLNKHHSITLQRAWNKYKEQNFKFEILELVKDKSQLISREQYYIDLLKPEYNILKIAGSRLGSKHSKETRKHLSKVKLEKFSSGQLSAWNKGRDNLPERKDSTKEKN